MENLIGFSIINYYTGGRGRTGTSLRTLDFESSASANSATPAYKAVTGFEPVMKVLQTSALPLGYTAIYVLLTGVAGFEPTHEGVKVPCLTAWLYPNKRANDENRTHECRSHNPVR